jgi:hypothetical protein
MCPINVFLGFLPCHKINRSYGKARTETLGSTVLIFANHWEKCNGSRTDGSFRDTGRQYPVKLDKDGVWRYRPEEGDFKPQKREDKLTCTFKTKKAKGKPLGKSKSKVKRSLDKAMDEV